MQNGINIMQIHGNKLTVELMKKIIDQGANIYVMNGCTEYQATLFKKLADEKKRGIVVIHGSIIQ